MVTVAGEEDSLTFTVQFDWPKEDHACSYCEPDPRPVHIGLEQYALVWFCCICGGGSAKLTLANNDSTQQH